MSPCLCSLFCFHFLLILTPGPHLFCWPTEFPVTPNFCSGTAFTMKLSLNIQMFSQSLLSLFLPFNLYSWIPPQCNYLLKERPQLDWECLLFVSSVLIYVFSTYITNSLGFPAGSVDRESACNAGDARDAGLILGREDPLAEEMAIHSSILAWETPWVIPGSGISLGGGNSNPFQYSYLENPMDRGAWRAIVHRV